MAWPMLFQVFFGMFLSFMVFPGLLIANPISTLESPDWTDLVCIGIFNIFDMLGRTLGGCDSLMIDIKRGFWLHFIGISRITIVALVIIVATGYFSYNTEL